METVRGDAHAIHRTRFLLKKRVFTRFSLPPLFLVSFIILCILVNMAFVHCLSPPPHVIFFFPSRFFICRFISY